MAAVPHLAESEVIPDGAVEGGLISESVVDDGSGFPAPQPTKSQCSFVLLKNFGGRFEVQEWPGGSKEKRYDGGSFDAFENDAGGCLFFGVVQSDREECVFAGCREEVPTEKFTGDASGDLGDFFGELACTDLKCAVHDSAAGVKTGCLQMDVGVDQEC